jgi:hypothetical protein
MGGVLAASPIAARLASQPRRLPRVAAPAVVGAAVSLLAVPLLFGG